MAYGQRNAFQSTLSVRRATTLFVDLVAEDEISIHALRKESDRRRTMAGRDEDISIHALRKESDDGRADRPGNVEISIHALRKESDQRAETPN